MERDDLLWHTNSLTLFHILSILLSVATQVRHVSELVRSPTLGWQAFIHIRISGGLKW